MDKMIIHAGDDGDWSVGIPGLNLTITIEGNTDLWDMFKGKHAEENRKDFREQLEIIVENWFSDMKPYAILEDECFDCGEILQKNKKGDWEHKGICPVQEAFER